MTTASFPLERRRKREEGEKGIITLIIMAIIYGLEIRLLVTLVKLRPFVYNAFKLPPLRKDWPKGS